MTKKRPCWQAKWGLRGNGRLTIKSKLEIFDADDGAVSQAHMMADPESVGEAGVDFMEGMVRAEAKSVFR